MEAVTTDQAQGAGPHRFLDSGWRAFVGFGTALTIGFVVIKVAFEKALMHGGPWDVIWLIYFPILIAASIAAVVCGIVLATLDAIAAQRAQRDKVESCRR
ncbi:MAG TPA: hypothetical protein VIJ18_06920 [Microbacteriaceae bacterium]